MSFAELRATRLAHDYAPVMSIDGSTIRVTPINGVPPYVDAYEFVINVRTIVGVDSSGSPQYRSSSTVRVSLPGDYPRIAPVAVMTTSPKPYHPNWWPNAKWCYGHWVASESLAAHVLRMVQTLQFDPSVTNPDSPADQAATSWWKKNATSGLFPCDKTRLPDYSSGSFRLTGRAQVQAGQPVFRMK
jgi:ubiquitin-protein ligase